MNATVSLSAAGTGKRVLGSFLSAFAGWSALTLTQLVSSLTRPAAEAYWWSFYPVVCIPFIVVVWLAVLLPLYVRVSACSVLWRWPVCTATGAAAGTMIPPAVWCVLDPYGITERFIDFLGVSWWLSGICGGAACLFGSLTAPVFRRCVGSALPLDHTGRLLTD